MAAMYKLSRIDDRTLQVLPPLGNSRFLWLLDENGEQLPIIHAEDVRYALMNHAEVGDTFVFEDEFPGEVFVRHGVNISRRRAA